MKRRTEMRAEWREELATGNELVDSPKRELIRRINALLDACRERKGRDEIGGFLEYMKMYVKEPLLEEESFLLARRYPFFREHRREHDLFVQRLSAVEAEFSRAGGSALVIVTAGKLLLDWVHDHIHRSDGLTTKIINN
jgi:hemerythrin